MCIFTALRGISSTACLAWPGRRLIPGALLRLTLGLWLTPRSLAGLRGRGATLAPEVRRWLAENRWGVLLIPVTLLGLTVFGVQLVLLATQIDWIW